MIKKKEPRTDNFDIAIMATYFVIPFYGLRIALENYLMDDELDLSYQMLLGFLSGMIVIIYIVVLKTKTTKVKIIGLGTLLTLVTIINLLVI